MKLDIFSMNAIGTMSWIAGNIVFLLIVLSVICFASIVLMLVRNSLVLSRSSKKKQKKSSASNSNEWKWLEKKEKNWLIHYTKELLSIIDSKHNWQQFMTIVIIWGCAFALISIVVFKNWKAAIPLFLLGSLFPYQNLYTKVLKRRETFLKQFLPTMSAFTSVYQNTQNRAMTISEIKEKLPEEMSREFNLMANKINSSIPIHECVEGFARRVNNKWAYSFATVMGIPDKVGGDIEESLIALTDKIGAEQINLGENTSNKQYVKSTFTVLLGLQFVSAIISFASFPDAYRIFTETFIGQLAFFFIAVCNLISMVVLIAITYKG